VRGYWHEQIPFYVRARDRKPLRVQRRELAALLRRYEYVPYHYLTESMFLPSFADDVTAFVPPRLVDRYVRHVNAGTPPTLAVDKDAFARAMRAVRLPAVETLFRFTPDGTIVDPDGASVPYREFVRRLAATRHDAFFLKPLASGQGKGARVLHLVDGALRCDGMELGAATFSSQVFGGRAHKNYLVQPWIVQHPLLDAITSSSVNTVRIDTFSVGGGFVHTAAVLRMSDGSRTTDNVSQGGFFVAVDVATGALGREARQLAVIDRRILIAHPETGFRFEGVVLPFWDEVKHVVTQAAEALLPLRSIGWDVAITPRGPVLVEANHTHGTDMLQDAVRGLAGTPLGMAALEHYRPRVARRVARHVSGERVSAVATDRRRASAA
jgi:hypothetical protein